MEKQLTEFIEYKNLILEKLTTFSDEIADLKEDIKNLSIKIEGLQGTYYSNCPYKPDVNDHETRIRYLERGFWKIFGVVVTIIFLFQIGIKYI